MIDFVEPVEADESELSLPPPVLTPSSRKSCPRLRQPNAWASRYRARLRSFQLKLPSTAPARPYPTSQQAIGLVFGAVVISFSFVWAALYFLQPVTQ
jgi:hypothetical protein